MRIALFNWRDLDQPKAGGAEKATDVLCSGLAARGHEVTWFTSRAEGQAKNAHRNGYFVIRAGNELTCRFNASVWLFKNRHCVDAVIDEVNTLPFFSPFVARGKTFLWMHQLARDIWRYEAPKHISVLGQALEAKMLQIYRNVPTITGAQSSASSIREYLPRNDINVAEYALEPPIGFSTNVVPGRLGFVGRIAPSKRVDHIISAFAIVRKRVPFATLVIVGGGTEAERGRLSKLCEELSVSEHVTFSGRVSDEELHTLIASFDVLLMASVREGWGLVVSEAARYGVPSVVYPVSGLVDSVVHGKTGLVTANERPEDLASCIELLVTNRALRDDLGKSAMEYINNFTRARFIERFEAVLDGSLRSAAEIPTSAKA